MKAQQTRDTFWHVVNKTLAGDPPYYVRFGDGEFLVMEGKPIPQCKEVIKEQSQEVAESFCILDKKYMRATALLPSEQEPGMKKGIFWEQKYHDYIVGVIEKMGLPTQDVFPNQIALHYYAKFKKNIFHEVMEELFESEDKVFVGSYHVEELPPSLGKFSGSVQTPRKCAYREIDRIMESLRKELGDPSISDKVVISSCGVVSNVIAKRLWHDGYRGIIFLDFGSLTDYMIGNKIRAWM